MNDKTLVVIDTETTGLDYKRDKIIEFAGVKLINGELSEEFTTFINPECKIRPSSIEIHHITNEMVADAPKLDEAMPKILDFIGDSHLVAHNAIFDYKFLNEASILLYEKELENHYIDTQHLFREVFPEEFSHGLLALLTRFGVEPTERHRALPDAKYLAMVYPELKFLYDQKYKWQLKQLDSIDYLFERYLRIQKTMHSMQAEMADLKSVFKVYFEEGGNPMEASTGELLTMQSKSSYSYNFEKIRDVLDEIDANRRAVKVNNALIDRMIGGISLPEEIKNRLRNGREKFSETRSVSIIKADRNNQDYNK